MRAFGGQGQVCGRKWDGTGTSWGHVRVFRRPAPGLGSKLCDRVSTNLYWTARTRGGLGGPRFFFYSQANS